MANDIKNPFLQRGKGGKDVDVKNLSADFVTKQNQPVERKLPKEVEEKYQLIGIQPGRVIWRDHEIDFRKVTVETCKLLVDAECPFIKEKDPAKPTPKAS